MEGDGGTDFAIFLVRDRWCSSVRIGYCEVGQSVREIHSSEVVDITQQRDVEQAAYNAQECFAHTAPSVHCRDSAEGETVLLENSVSVRSPDED